MRKQWKMRILAWGVASVAIPAWTVASAPENLELDCVITPSSIIDVGSAVPGVVETLLVDRSDRIEKGQLLAQLESTVESIEVEIAKARAKMTASVELWKVNVAFDNRDMHRLSSMDTASTRDKDDAEREALTSKWRLKDAFDNVRQRELELLRAQAVMERRRITSPIDGIVLQRLREPGEKVDEESVIRVAQLDPLYVEVVLPMEHFDSLKPGMQASVVSEHETDKQRTAEVVVVDGIGDAASGTFGVRLALANPDHDITSGVKCRVQFDGLEITTEQTEEVTQADVLE